MLIVCNGMIRSGSTLHYNWVRAILEHAEAGEAEGFFKKDEFSYCAEQFAQWHDSPECHLVKVHDMFLVEELAEVSGEQARYLFSYRDLYEVVPSSMRAFQLSFDEVVERLDEAVELYDRLKTDPRCLMQPFERMREDPIACIRQIADFLAVELSDAQVQEIHMNTRLDTMTEKSKRSGSNLRIVLSGILWRLNKALKLKQLLLRIGLSERLWVSLRRKLYPHDNKTLLRAGHIASGDKGVELSRAQKEAIATRYARWLAECGYSDETRIAESGAAK